MFVESPSLFFGGAASVFAEAFSTSLKGDGFQNSQGNRVIESERGKRRGTGAKWKGHIYKVRVQRDSRPNQIASREPKRTGNWDTGMGKVSEL